MPLARYIYFPSHISKRVQVREIMSYVIYDTNQVAFFRFSLKRSLNANINVFDCNIPCISYLDI